MKNRDGRGRRGDGWIHSLPFFDGCKTPEKPPQTSATPFFFSCLMTPLTSFCLCFFLVARGFLFLCVCRSISSAKKGKEKEQTHTNTHTPQILILSKKKKKKNCATRTERDQIIVQRSHADAEHACKHVREAFTRKLILMLIPFFFFFFFFSKR